jgi:hypothetical protein
MGSRFPGRAAGLPITAEGSLPSTQRRLLPTGTYRSRRVLRQLRKRSMRGPNRRARCRATPPHRKSRPAGALSILKYFVTRCGWVRPYSMIGPGVGGWQTIVASIISRGPQTQSPCLRDCCSISHLASPAVSMAGDRRAARSRLQDASQLKGELRPPVGFGDERRLETIGPVA